MAADESRIWVGGLPEGIKEDEIREAFKQYGEIESVSIRSSKGAPCFAFVQYNNKHDAEDAIKGANQAKLFGQPFVKVSWAGKTSKGKGKGKGGGRSRSRSRSRRRSRRNSRSPSNRRSPSRNRRSPSRNRRSPSRGGGGGGDRGRGREPPRRRSPSNRRSPARSGGNDRRSPPRRSPPRPPRPPSRRRSASRKRTPPRRSRSPRREASRARSRSPRRDSSSKGGGKGNMTQGKYRIKLQNLPQDMGWQEFKDVGGKYAKAGECTFARTNRDCTGVLEYTAYEDMCVAIEELDGRRFSGGDVKLVAYEDKGSR